MITREDLVCIITLEIFYEPVLAQDGHVYEKQAIEEWFETNNTSPRTTMPINKTLTPVIFIKNLVNKYLEMYPHEKNKSIQTSNYNK